MKRTDKTCPREFFSVSEHVSYLEPVQIRHLEKAFTDWKGVAKRANSVLARERMWLIFVLLRHTGARLGEVLSLDDTEAFDKSGPLVRLGGGDRVREVPLAEDFYSEVMDILESPMGCGLRGSFFHVDPGYFRRICYARGKECGLPKELVGPNALRNTRAIEMLRAGVPITIVKDILGQSSLDLTAHFQQFSREDIRSIVDSAHQAMRQRTSARNSFIGHVLQITFDAVMAEVVLETRSGIRVCAVITAESLRNLKITEGTPVIATVKAPLVNVIKSLHTPVGSARNRFSARVMRVTGATVISEILGQLPDGTEVCALVSTHRADSLALQPGETVEFWFKSLSVVLNTVQLWD
ncbi:TOBE domain-containing protein [Pseudodesulfovibrio piezophilus]|uniref:TOBE domain protein n=1 Tax=Pseudodesulfovibrio piezophilus (strain DSM 21447 / JCM 15486 / C1TLV30) TaxID=1322246 RepID=M1WPV4_PSEP2|nr:TOBE domain-containing protein [Pseudodesulfovibrio piezophilus]CCH48609.1 TOBE domain protein [Pseudodesulfovibrio piezophilus C1TLV30]